MGGLFTKKFKVNERYPGQGSNVIVSAGKLKLQRRDIDRIYTGFCKLDVDGSGLISVHEFIVMNQVQSASFGELAFRVLDTNSSGKIDFLEFMIAIWNFCSLSKESLSLFSFQIFDADKSGVLTYSEFRHMIDVVWGFATNDHLEAALRMLDRNKDGEVTLKEFIETVHRAPVLLFPTFELQEKIRKSVLGAKAWERISKDRAVAFGEGTVFEIIEKSLETDDEFHINKTIAIVSKDPKAPAGFADRVRRMSIERRERKQAIDAAIANNAAIEAAGKNKHASHDIAPPKSSHDSPAFAKKSKKVVHSDKHKGATIAPSS